MKKQPKTHRKQFQECSDAGMYKAGELQKFKDHPELLPLPFCMAAKKVAEAMKTDPDAGLTPLVCLRFGGECSGRNPECRKLRGVD